MLAAHEATSTHQDRADDDSASQRKSDIHIIRVHAPETIRTRVHASIIRSRKLWPLSKMLLIHLLDDSRAGEVHDTDRDKMCEHLGSGPPTKRRPHGRIGISLLEKLIRNAKECGFLRIEQPNSIIDGTFVTHWYVAEEPGEFHWGKQLGFTFTGQNDPCRANEGTGEADAPCPHYQGTDYPRTDGAGTDDPCPVAPTPPNGMGSTHPSHPTPARAHNGAEEETQREEGAGQDGRKRKARVADVLLHWFGQGDKAILTSEDAAVLQRAYFGDDTVLSIDILRRCGIDQREATRFAEGLHRRRILSVLKYTVDKLNRGEAVKDLPAFVHRLLAKNSKPEDFTEVGKLDQMIRTKRNRKPVYHAST